MKEKLKNENAERKIRKKENNNVEDEDNKIVTNKQ